MNYNKTSTTKALQSVNDMSAQNKVWKDTQPTTPSAYFWGAESKDKRTKGGILIFHLKHLSIIWNNHVS